ncbi:MAG: UDP-N-acetylglucosamine 2-epimerase [Candidatus Hodarchaeota archaeon]
MSESDIKKIFVFLGSRANYSSLISIMRNIKKSPKLELILVAGASSILDKYGEVATLVEDDGFKINERIYMLIEGENPETMSKTTGLGLIELSTVLLKYKPNFTLLIADRYEMLAAAIASAYNNIPIAHIQGGEVSGSIDESVRHAITKLAHVHFPSNEIAKQRILQMGENEEYVFNFGCPRIDIVKEIIKKGNQSKEVSNFVKVEGVGDVIDIDDEFLLVAQHPVTTEYGAGREQIRGTLKAVKEISQERAIPVIVLWPNSDAGSDEISKEIRVFRENHMDKNFHFIKNFPFTYYIWLMNKTTCLIGNSSSGIREGAFIGTPVVNIGTRQNDRARGNNIIDTDYNWKNICNAVKKQIEHGKYDSENIYGDGNAGERIVKTLETIEINVQKRFITRNFN